MAPSASTILKTTFGIGKEQTIVSFFVGV